MLTSFAHSSRSLALECSRQASAALAPAHKTQTEQSDAFTHTQTQSQAEKERGRTLATRRTLLPHFHSSNLPLFLSHSLTY